MILPPTDFSPEWLHRTRGLATTPRASPLPPSPTRDDGDGGGGGEEEEEEGGDDGVTSRTSNLSGEAQVPPRTENNFRSKKPGSGQSISWLVRM